MAGVKPGERRQCTECGTAIVVIKPDGSVPHCCGRAMESVSAAKR
jgi:endogenous inhibitor of DNA gyrase (YacG/DUF329 family)